MIHAHVLDAWTREADRTRDAFYWASFLGGLAGPAFLTMAGLGSALSGASQRARGVGHWAVTAALVRRGVYVFALAFVFRVQALLLGWGSPTDLLRVDILNVMGVALVFAGVLWGVAPSAWGRVLLATVTTALLAWATPYVRAAGWIDALPPPLQWYLRPTPGRTNFTLLPWTAFVTAGLGLGTMLAAQRSDRRERLFQTALGALGLAGVAVAYWASTQPSIYPAGLSTFWGPSPAFFGLRLALVALLLPLCFAIRRRLPASIGRALATLGASSLFVYWVHVELVYGGIAIPVKRRLPLELTALCTLAMAYAMAQLVPWARRWVSLGGPRPVLARRLVARLL